MNRPSATTIASLMASTSVQVPPQDVELEKAVLGAMMLERTAIYDTVEFLRPESFYLPAHQDIYTAIKELFEEGAPVDLLTISQRLKRNGKLDDVGGAYYLTQLTGKVASTANTAFHARLIVQEHLKREAIALAMIAQKDGYDPQKDPFQLLDELGLKVSDLQTTYESKAISTPAEHAAKLMDNTGPAPFIEWGIPELDAGCRLYLGKSHVIAARPGVGKSIVGLYVAWHHAKRCAELKKGQVVVYFSPEMTGPEITSRLMSIETGIPYSTIFAMKMNEQELAIYAQAFEYWGDVLSKHFIIDDTPGLTIGQMRARLERWHRQQGVRMWTVDYLQKMFTGDRRVDSDPKVIAKVSRCSNACTEIAKTMNIPCVYLSQFSREIEKRTDPIPRLSDLRESGEIEQDVSVAILMWRENYRKTGVVQDTLHLEVAKHRGGALGDVPVMVDLALNRVGGMPLPQPSRQPEPSNQDTNPF